MAQETASLLDFASTDTIVETDVDEVSPLCRSGSGDDLSRFGVADDGVTPFQHRLGSKVFQRISAICKPSTGLRYPVVHRVGQPAVEKSQSFPPQCDRRSWLVGEQAASKGVEPEASRIESSVNSSAKAIRQLIQPQHPLL